MHVSTHFLPSRTDKRIKWDNVDTLSQNTKTTKSFLNQQPMDK
jgi:hypothetical protein